MPTFVDHHPTAPMSPEMAQAAVEKLKSGQADQFGVTESDSAESVHKSMGISLGEGTVTQVQALV